MELQKWISHIAQVIYTDSMFTSYFYLEQVKSKQVPAAITHNLVYQLFLLLNRQGKKAGEEVKYCFDSFCEYLSERISLNEFKGQRYQTIISFITKQYETLVCNNISSNFEKRTTPYFLGCRSSQWVSSVEINSDARGSESKFEGDKKEKSGELVKKSKVFYIVWMMNHRWL